MHPSIYLSIYLHIYPPIHLFVYRLSIDSSRFGCSASHGASSHPSGFTLHHLIEAEASGSSDGGAASARGRPKDLL